MARGDYQELQDQYIANQYSRRLLGADKQASPMDAVGFRKAMEKRISDIETELARHDLLKKELERLKKMVAADLEGRDR